MAPRRHVAIAAAFGIASTAMLTPTASADQPVLPGAGAQAVEGSYIVVLHGFSVTGMSERQARRLAADPDVEFVERNTFATIQDTQSNPAWGLDRIDQANLPLNQSYTYPNTASNVTAYVLDTGIRKTHSEFEGHASDGYDFSDNDAVAQDCQGHGSHVAGAAALYLSANPSATPAQVRGALVGAATPNKLTDIRAGSVNLLPKV